MVNDSAGNEDSSKVNKGGRPKTERTLIKEQKDTLDAILNEVRSVNERVNVLESVKSKTLPAPPSTIIKEDVTGKTEWMKDSGVKGATQVHVKTEPIEPQEMDIPEAYIKAKNQILGEDFGISMTMDGDNPAYILQIVVPTNKSNMTDLQKDLKKADIRTASISQTAGINGVIEWLMRIRQNLGLDD